LLDRALERLGREGILDSLADVVAHPAKGRDARLGVAPNGDRIGERPMEDGASKKISPELASGPVAERDDEIGRRVPEILDRLRP